MKHLGDELHAYLDGELDEVPRAAAEAHLRDCAACRQRLAALRALDEAVAEQPVPDPGPLYWDSFAARVEQRLPERRTGRTVAVSQWLTGWFFAGERLAWGRALGAAALCTVLVYVGMRGFRASPARLAMEAPAPVEVAPPAARPGTADAVAPRQAPAPPLAVGQGEPLAAKSQPAAPALPPAQKVSTLPPVASTEGGPAKAKPTEGASEAPPALAPGEEQLARTASDAAATTDASHPPPGVLSAERPLAPRSTVEVASPAAPAPGKGLGTGLRERRAAVAEPRTSLQAELEPDANSLALPDSTAGADAWLALDARFWPQHTSPGMRPTAEKIASGLARHREDARAVLRTRAYATYLASTSPSDSERTRWEELLRTLPPR